MTTEQRHFIIGVVLLVFVVFVATISNQIGYERGRREIQASLSQSSGVNDPSGVGTRPVADPNPVPDPAPTNFPVSENGPTKSDPSGVGTPIDPPKKSN